MNGELPVRAAIFRDDNSLIKGVPRGFPIHNPANPLMDRRKLGTGFVASHVWRVLVGGGHANREPQTYSFVPNVVWLPSQVSKLTDREGLFVQSYLQALSARIHRGLKLNPKLEAIVAPIWDQLEVRPEVAGVAMPDPGALNYFEVSENWLTRRVKTVNLVILGSRRPRPAPRPSERRFRVDTRRAYPTFRLMHSRHCIRGLPLTRVRLRRPLLRLTLARGHDPASSPSCDSRRGLACVRTRHLDVLRGVGHELRENRLELQPIVGRNQG
jgi:hypothetical protein